MDVERTIEFILEHQARFSAGMDEIRQEQARFSAGMNDLRQMVGQLAAHQIELVHHIGRIDNAVLTLADSQRHTDERLNALISVVQGMQGGSRS